MFCGDRSLRSSHGPQRVTPPAERRIIAPEPHRPRPAVARSGGGGETGSTNADLLARAAAGEDIDGAVLLAESQTAGRGRHGRSWSTPPRSQIALSVGVGVRPCPTRRGAGCPC